MDSVTQFRDYLFRTNPQSITVGYTSGLVSHFCPGQGDVVQDLGEKVRSIVCRGCFWGETYQQAMAELEEFRRKAEGDEAGLLFLPGMEPFPARLRELLFEVTGDGKIIPYTMTFLAQVVA